MSNPPVDVIKQVVVALEKERPYLYDMNDLIQKIDDGVIVFTVKVFRGKATEMTYTTTKRKRYQTKPDIASEIQ